jgi:hypothetical protein
MAIKFDEIDMYEIFQDLGRVCRTQNVCTECEQAGCLVEYGKACADKCAQDGVTYVEQGVEGMPYGNPDEEFHDEVYNELEVLLMLSHLLVQCRTCKEDHYDNCIISVLRNCLERITLGDTLPYQGTPLGYMVDFSKRDDEKAQVIATEYQKKKEVDLYEQGIGKHIETDNCNA